MVAMSMAFSQHRFWEMKDVQDSSEPAPPVTDPFLPPWEKATLSFRTEKGEDAGRWVWVRPIPNGKIPMGAVVFDVKACGFQERKLSFVGELTKGWNHGGASEPAPEQRQALAVRQAEETPACPFCGERGLLLVQTAVMMRGGHATILANYPLFASVGCEPCRAARGFPDRGFLVPCDTREGGVTKDEIIAALWAELDRLDKAK